MARRPAPLTRFTVRFRILLFFWKVRQHNVGSLLGEHRSDGAPDPAITARDQGGAAEEFCMSGVGLLTVVGRGI